MPHIRKLKPADIRPGYYVGGGRSKMRRCHGEVREVLEVEPREPEGYGRVTYRTVGYLGQVTCYLRVFLRWAERRLAEDEWVPLKAS